MKKILGVVFASVALISGAFAKGIYSGDVQVNLGFNALSNELKVGSIKSTTSGGAFSADLQTWHLFALNDIISLGGRAGLNFDIGAFTKMTTDGNSVDLDDSNVTSLRFSIGPAVGFTFGDTV